MNVFDLFAKLSLDTSEYEQGLNDTEKKAYDFGGKIGKALSTGAKVIGTSVTVAAGAVGKLVKDSASSYADYEQLVGGVETLFGDSAEKVLANSEVAFKNAGLSMNEYMETSIQSAAALISSLGGDTDKAANLMDMSITDMSDNVNKMGTTMEAVQNAYRGFSRGNFTMLDNLALGFSGTKEGMQELLDKAGEISGIEYDIDSYSDIVQAIHVVQEEMGIMNTTAEEAGGTISGSLGMMKSAWSNLITEISKPNGDIGSSIDNLMTSIVGDGTDKNKGVLGNLMPVLENALSGIGNFIERAAPMIAEKLPGLIDSLLPPLLSAATSIVESLVASLPVILQSLVDALPGIVTTIIDVLVANLPLLLSVGGQIILALVNGIAQSLPDLIPQIVDVILTIVDNLLSNIDLLIDTAGQLISGLAEGLIMAIPVLIEKAPQIVISLAKGIVQSAARLLEVGVELILSIITGIVKAFGKLLNIGKDIVDAVKDGFKQKIEDAKNWGKDMIENFVGGIKEKWNKLKDGVAGVANTVKDFLGFSEPKKGPLSNFHTYAPDMMELFTKGIADNEDMLTSQISKTFDINSKMPVLDNTNIMKEKSGYSGIMSMLEDFSNRLVGGDTIIPVYIGTKQIDEIVMDANKRVTVRSGGKAYV